MERLGLFHRFARCHRVVEDFKRLDHAGYYRFFRRRHCLFSDMEKRLSRPVQRNHGHVVLKLHKIRFRHSRHRNIQYHHIAFSSLYRHDRRNVSLDDFLPKKISSLQTRAYLVKKHPAFATATAGFYFMLFLSDSILPACP